MAIELKWKHQQKTYELMQEQLKRTGKAVYIFPTGSGKSFPALKYVENNPKKRVLIVSPYIVVNNQFKKYIREYIPNGQMRLQQKNIVTITYQKINLMQNRAKGVHPDVIILDEIHRIGGEKWEKAVDSLLRAFPSAEVIGMSATPERMNGRNMAYEKFGDSVVYQMSLTEALSGEKEGEVILPSPRYYKVLSGLNETIENYRKQIANIEDADKRNELLKQCERLSRVTENATEISDVMREAMGRKPNGKYIVFCRDGDDLQQKMKEAQKIFGKVNSNINCQYVFSKLQREDKFGKTKKENTRTIEEFENSENGYALNLLFCVDMLNEGIHIEGIDGEVLFDLTRSPILYKQRIGRILSATSGLGEKVVIDAVGNWIEQLDVYRELGCAMLEGEKKEREYGTAERNRSNYDTSEINCDLLTLSAEEKELLAVMEELNERLRYQENNFLESARDIQNWCENNFGIGNNVSEDRRLPMKTAKDNEERRLGQTLVTIRYRICKQYEGIRIEDIENERHREIVGIIRYLDKTYMSEKQKNSSNKHTYLESARDIQNWCENNFGIGNNVSEDRRLPMITTKDNEERALGRRLNVLNYQICKKYEGIRIEDIENKRDREIVGIIRYVNETYKSDLQRRYSSRKTYLESAMEIQEWCEKSFKGRDNISEDKRLPMAGAKDSEEKKLGKRLRDIRSRVCKRYEGIETEDIKDGEHREIVRIIRYLDEEYMSEKQRKSSEKTKKAISRIRTAVIHNIGTNENIRNELEGRTYIDGQLEVE